MSAIQLLFWKEHMTERGDMEKSGGKKESLGLLGERTRPNHFCIPATTAKPPDVNNAILDFPTSDTLLLQCITDSKKINKTTFQLRPQTNYRIMRTSEVVFWGSILI